MYAVRQVNLLNRHRELAHHYVFANYGQYLEYEQPRPFYLLEPLWLSAA